MIEKPLPLMKKNNNDKKHRIYQAIQSIKDAILKRKFNQAWDHAAKYYEQNKSSLRNEEIYQLCWLSCQSITKKTNIRLKASPKSYLPPLTQTHLQHLFSLYLSLHILIFPEITNKDRQHFDMLSTQQTLINPKAISPHDLVFQRKPSQFFLQKEQINKELKKLVKQHLRIANNALMFKVKTRKCQQDVIEAAKNVQEIFDSFKESEFPVEAINFQIIKLSIMEDLGIKEGIKCQYRLPIGLINKIYTHLRGNKEVAVQHYLKKLSSYLVLSIRNLVIPIEDIYIVCQQMLFLTKMVHEKTAPPPYQYVEFKKKLPLLKLNRQITIEKDPIEENMMSRSNKSNISSSFSTNNKISQKKLQSKTRLFKPQGQLKNIAIAALDKINNHLAGRREVNQIILSYFSEIYFKNLKSDPSDEIIQNEISLQVSRKNRKNGNFQQNNDEDISEQCEQKQYRSLTNLLKKKGLQKKISAYDDSEQKEAVITNPSNKKQGKFISRNIQLIKRDNKHNEDDNKKIEKILNNATSIYDIQLIDASSSDQEGNLRLNYQRQRRKQMKILNSKYSIKLYEQPKTSKKENTSTEDMDGQQTSSGYNEQQRVRSISLLDDVVNSVVNNLLQLPQNRKKGAFSMHSSDSNHTLKKLSDLKNEVENLNLQRTLLVERLIKKSHSNSINKLNLSDSFQKKIDEINKKQEDIQLFSQKFKEKVQKHIDINSKLMNLQKENKFKINVQPKIKLKLEKGCKKIPELTFARLEEEYKKIEGLIDDKREAWDMVLSCQYDKLRRDVAKNQFASQNEKKNANKKPKCQTILEKTYDDEVM